MALQVARRLFTVDEYSQMAAAGILHEDDRVELIAGGDAPDGPHRELSRRVWQSFDPVFCSIYGWASSNSRRGLKCLNFNALFFELS